MARGPWHQAEVLMTVKAYPNPQQDYGEASCTAGITREGRWVRINPMPFRLLAPAQQFEKWERIRAELRRSSDPRPESHNVRPDSIAVLDKVTTGRRRDWVDRNALIAPFFVATVDELVASAQRRERTMAYLRPARVKRLIIEARPDPLWNEKQAGKVGRQQLFGRTPTPLRRVPFRFSYEFDCARPGCGGHRMQILDWEIHGSYWKWLGDYGDDGWESAMRTKYERWMIDERDLVFNLGDIARRPGQLVICSLHYPPKRSEVKDPHATSAAQRLFG